MGSLIGFIIAIGSLLGGYAALGGHLTVLWQPWEFVIIGGTALGIFIVGNTLRTVRDWPRSCETRASSWIELSSHHCPSMDVEFKFCFSPTTFELK